MSFEPRLELVFDVDAPAADRAMFPHDGAGVPQEADAAGLYVWVSGDACPLRVFLWSSVGGENLRLPSGHQIKVFGVGDAAGELGTEDTLFESTGFTEVNIGTEEAPIWAYDIDLSLATEELEDALDGEKQITARVDIELAVSGGTSPKSARMYPKILRQAYTGNTPTPADPELPAPESIVTKIRGTVTVGSGESSGSVTGLALGAVPAQVLLTLRTPSAGSALIAAVVAGAPTADGFDWELGAATPAAGYKLDYLIIL